MPRYVARPDRPGYWLNTRLRTDGQPPNAPVPCWPGEENQDDIFLNGDWVYVKDLDNQLPEKKEFDILNDVIKPWGKYEVLWRGPDALLKRLTILKGQAISYQYHLRRSEVWTVVRGMGLLTLDSSDRLISTGETVTIGRGVRHSVEATTTDLVLYELQVGEPDEDDIVRISDKYGRT